MCKYYFLKKKKWRKIAKSKNYSNYGIAPKVAIFTFNNLFLGILKPIAIEKFWGISIFFNKKKSFSHDIIFEYLVFEKKKFRKIAKTKNYSNSGIAAKVAVFHFQQILLRIFKPIANKECRGITIFFSKKKFLAWNYL